MAMPEKQTTKKAAAKKPAAKKTKVAKASAAGAPQVDIVNAENKPMGQVALSSEVFGVRVNEPLLYEAVKQYRAGARRGTHMTKNRALVSGSGRKPWRQ